MLPMVMPLRLHVRAGYDVVSGLKNDLCVEQFLLVYNVGVYAYASDLVVVV